MTIFRNFLIIALTVALAGVTQAQLSTSLKLNKKQYLAGEPVVAAVTITNHAGVTLTFASDNRKQWISFLVKDRLGNPVTIKNHQLFGKMTIRAGESLSREFDLNQYFHLDDPGNYSVYATIFMPGKDTGSSATNRVLFNQSPGSLYWNQKVGISGKAREFRLLNFNGDEKSQIYAKIIDTNSGNNIRAFLLGDVLMLRKPLATVDREQRMHVMFLATPTMWVHYQIDTDGKVTNREIHQRGSQGDPQLITFADGSVRVGNSIPYNAKAAAESKSSIRKATDRPNY